SPLRDPNLVLASIALRLDIDERDRIPLNERLRAALHAQSVLLVLDNFEHVAAARFDVLELLESCAGVTVLATSRAPLRVRAEREYRVKPLDIPLPDEDPETISSATSVTMFRERAQAAGVNLAITAESAPVIAQICARLDGLPLAIELAAAWTRLLSPSALLSRLDQRLPLLVDGPHDLPTRQRTMSDTVAWSYGLLDDRGQRLFRWLSVFVGGCTTTSIEAILESAGTNVLSQLLALVEQSVIRIQPSPEEGDLGLRIVMLETLREFGLDRLEATGEASEARQRHATHYLELVETAEAALSGPEALNWRQRLELEHDNLRSALRWSIEMGEGEIALRFTSALWRFWSERGHLSEGLGWMRQSLAVADVAMDTSAALRAKTLAGAAFLAIEQAAYDEAADLCADAIALARQHSARHELVVALNTLGLLSRQQGRYEHSFQCYDDARRLAETLGDRLGVATALSGLVYTSLQSGEVAQAISYSEQSVSLFRALGDSRGQAEALIGMAAHAAHAGPFDLAETSSAEALDLFRAIGDTGRVADALWVLGVAVQFRGDFEYAERLHTECLTLRRARGDLHGVVQSRQSLARIELQWDKPEEARALLDESMIVLLDYDDPWGEAMGHLFLGHVNLTTGDDAAAEERFQNSVSLHHSIGNSLYLPWCVEGIAGVAAARKHWSKGARLCGARDALREAAGTLLPPAHPHEYERTLIALRSALGDEEFNLDYEAGRRQSMDQILAELELAGEIDRA
ncbi:MAG: tetratricopeptide repeat protein, partial [Nitrolancea sp.]